MYVFVCGSIACQLVLLTNAIQWHLVTNETNTGLGAWLGTQCVPSLVGCDLKWKCGLSLDALHLLPCKEERLVWKLKVFPEGVYLFLLHSQKTIFSWQQVVLFQVLHDIMKYQLNNFLNLDVNVLYCNYSNEHELEHQLQGCVFFWSVKVLCTTARVQEGYCNHIVTM